MGLFDGYNFDPGSGGLLGLLAQSFGGGGSALRGANRLGQPEEIAPDTKAASLFGNGMNLPAQPPSGFPMMPPQADSALPPNAAPTAGATNRNGTGGVTLPQMGSGGLGQGGGGQGGLEGLLSGLFGGGSQQAPAQQPALAASPGIGAGDRAMAALANFSNSRGFLPALTGAITGATSGQRTDPAGMMLQQQAATYQALLPALTANGMKPQQAAALAQAAALNPEVLKTIAPELYQKTQLVDMGTDPLTGMKTQARYDPNTGQLTQLTPGVQGGGAGGPQSGVPATAQQVFDQIDQARNSGAGTDKMLELVPNSLRSGVKAMLEGQALPTNLSNRGAARDLTLRFAHAVDPQFDESLIPARVALQKSYQGGGKNYQETLALNTVGGHLLRLKDAADDLGNTGFKPWNWLKNQTTSALTGNPALVKFRNDLVTTQNELAKAYHGGHVSDSAFNAFNNSINEAQTPAELKTAIGELSGLLQSKITANETGYKTGMNGLPLPSQYRAINNEAQHSFGEIDKWVRSGTEPQQKTMAPIDKQALDWAAAHPNDPRAAKIKQLHGIQ